MTARALTGKTNFSMMRTLSHSCRSANEPMRLLINVFVAIMLLLGTFYVPCSASAVDHPHTNQIAVSVAPTSADGHHRSDARSILGSHCQPDGIIAQSSASTSRHSVRVSFRAAAFPAISGCIELVEQRPPIAWI
jgi:hypothetical protein